MSDYIGKYVKKFESGAAGSRCFSQCGNDWGISCGSYQLTLRWGNCIRFLNKYYPEESAGLYFSGKDIPSSEWLGGTFSSSPEAVKEVWLKCVDKDGDDKFFEKEHEYIKAMFYDKFLETIKEIYTPTSRGMQECFWSWAVHKGWQGAEQQFKDILKEQNIVDPKSYSQEGLFNLIYEKRFTINNYDRYLIGSKWSEPEQIRHLLQVPVLKKENNMENKHYIELTQKVKQGSQGEGVKLLQLRLARISEEFENEVRGHSFDASGEPDGVFGAGMAETLKKFQRSVGLDETGVLDTETMDVLNMSPGEILSTLRAKTADFFDEVKELLDDFLN